MIGIALSGGGARGIAHLGVLQALDELGVKLQALSGTSLGAMVGAFYADGVSPREVLELFKKTSFYRLIWPAMSRTGLLNIQQLQNILETHLAHHQFEDLAMDFTAVATDVSQGRSVYFNQGPLIPAILASCCMPVIFKPLKLDGVSYIDGGILNNLPVEPLEPSCDIIIGSHCNPVEPNFKVKHAKALLERTFLLAIRNNTFSRMEKCHLFLEPQRLGKFIGSDFDKAQEIFDIAYQYTLSKRVEIMRLTEDGI